MNVSSYYMSCSVLGMDTGATRCHTWQLSTHVSASVCVPPNRAMFCQERAFLGDLLLTVWNIQALQNAVLCRCVESGSEPSGGAACTTTTRSLEGLWLKPYVNQGSVSSPEGSSSASWQGWGEGRSVSPTFAVTSTYHALSLNLSLDHHSRWGREITLVVVCT